MNENFGGLVRNYEHESTVSPLEARIVQ